MAEKRSKWKILFGSAVGVGLAVAAWIAFCGYQWSWGPFAALHDGKVAKLPGNAEEYMPENVNTVDNSPLACTGNAGRTHDPVCIPDVNG